MARKNWFFRLEWGKTFKDCNGVSTLNPEEPKNLMPPFFRLKMRVRLSASIFVGKDNPDCHALDNVVFDVLGLMIGEREAVSEAVVELVEKRLEKAKSINDGGEQG